MLPVRLTIYTALSVVLLGASSSRAATTVSHSAWGSDKSGAPVELYVLSAGVAEVRIATYGARIVSLRVPDREGRVASVVIGNDTLDPYLRPGFYGATMGRYANRIAKGHFTLNGATYELPVGRDGNTLHGGTAGFDRKVWQAKEIKDGVEMTLLSPDGDMGFPGNLTLHVAFTLQQQKDKYALRLAYTATTDKATVVNFTNHTYFNLSGDPANSVLRDIARIDATTYTPGDPAGIPTGEIQPVAGTPFDFHSAHAIGKQIPERGYDNNFVLAPHTDRVPIAEVDDPASGRTLQVFTTEPAMQFFVPVPRAQAPGQPATGQPAAGQPAAGQGASGSPTPGQQTPGSPAPGGPGQSRPFMAAFCLETQHFPDSPNHPNFPSTKLEPGGTFRSATTYLFGVLPEPR